MVNANRSSSKEMNTIQLMLRAMVRLSEKQTNSKQTLIAPGWMARFDLSVYVYAYMRVSMAKCTDWCTQSLHLSAELRADTPANQFVDGYFLSQWSLTCSPIKRDTSRITFVVVVAVIDLSAWRTRKNDSVHCHPPCQHGFMGVPVWANFDEHHHSTKCTRDTCWTVKGKVINLYWALGWWILVNNTVIGGGSSLFDNNRYHHGNNWKWSLPIGMNAWIIDLLTSALPGYANNDYFNPKHVRWILFLNLLDLKCCKLFNQIEHELNPLNYGWFWYHVHLELGVHPLVHLMLLFQTFLLGSSILKVKVVLIVQAPMFAKAYLKPRFNLPVRKIQESVWKYKIEMDEQFLFENAPGQFGSFLQVQILFDTKLTLQDCQLIGCERCPSFAIRSMFTKLNCFCFVKEKILVIKANRTTYLMDSAWKHLVSNRIRIPPRILNIPHCPQRKNHLTSKGWKN